MIQLIDRSIREVVAKLPAEIRLDPQIMFESVTGTTRYVFNVTTGCFKIELFRLSDDEHDQERFKRRLHGFSTQLNRIVFLPTAEDVVVTKLRWAHGAGRGKDRDDVRDVVAVQGSSLDFDYIQHWTSLHGTSELLAEIRASIPPLDDDADA